MYLLKTDQIHTQTHHSYMYACTRTHAHAHIHIHIKVTYVVTPLSEALRHLYTTQVLLGQHY